MKPPANYKAGVPSTPESWNPGVPLWQVVPTRDANGAPLSDFMMLIPGLKHRSMEAVTQIATTIRSVLDQYTEVVFADINLPVNVLWVSFRHRPGLVLELAAAIKMRVPEALLVAHNPHR